MVCALRQTLQDLHLAACIHCRAKDDLLKEGRVHDEHRIQYLEHYLAELEKAIAAGSDVRGYFYWATTDNFEWSSGLGHRMGFIRVDYETQRRTVKDSAYWYRDLICSQDSSVD